MIKADTNKVNMYVLPNLKKSIALLNDSYNISCDLKNVLLDASINVSDIPNKIYNLKKELNLLNISINKKNDNINSIEFKKNNMISKFNLSLNNIKNTNLKNKISKTNSTEGKIVSGFSSILKSTFSMSNKIYNICTSTCAKIFDNIKSYFVKKKDTDFFNNNPKVLSNEYKIQKLNKIEQLAITDSQINTSGKFADFTDFQNIMLSDMSLIELLFDGNESSLEGKNIGELYKESLTVYNKDELEYDKIVFDADTMLEMSKKCNWSKYRSLVLGKLVRYGFSDIKIKQKISGDDGFDAFILEDINGNIMVYFPCTNLVEKSDYLYDSYPVMESISNSTSLAGNLIGAKKIYSSQQKQAQELLNKCIKNTTPNSKVNVSGFSLGGSLAENAYLKSYDQNSRILGNIVLFNPYHDRLSNEEANKLKKSNKLKMYVCEGDSVSTVFNYDDFKDITKSIYIDYKDSVSNSVDNIDNNQSILNLIVNNWKNEYCDDFISVCNSINNNVVFNLPLKASLELICKSLETIKEKTLNTTELFREINAIIDKTSPILKTFGIDLSEKYNLEFLENLQYIETIFTSTHLTYTVDKYKSISFDSKGNVAKKIKLNNKIHDVGYPSFNKTSVELLGSNPYKEISDILNDIEH